MRAFSIIGTSNMPNNLVNLSPRHILAAHMLASGKSLAETAAETSFSVDTLKRYKSSEDLFKHKIQEIRAQVEEALIQHTINLAIRFDGLAHKATDVSEAILDDAVDSVELRHSTATVNIVKDVLDRAPNSPKSRKFVEGTQAQLVIQLGMKAVEGIKEALTDIGDTDVVDLIEGPDNEKEDGPNLQSQVTEV